MCMTIWVEHTVVVVVSNHSDQVMQNILHWWFIGRCLGFRFGNWHRRLTHWWEDGCSGWRRCLCAAIINNQKNLPTQWIGKGNPKHSKSSWFYGINFHIILISPSLILFSKIPQWQSASCCIQHNFIVSEHTCLCEKSLFTRLCKHALT